jgi:hypothetical protein
MLTVMTPICNLDEQQGRQAGKLHLINAEVGTSRLFPLGDSPGIRQRQPVLTSCIPITARAATQRGSLGFAGPRELCPCGDCQYPR